jgi:hypothetical protein
MVAVSCRISPRESNHPRGVGGYPISYNVSHPRGFRVLLFNVLYNITQRVIYVLYAFYRLKLLNDNLKVLDIIITLKYNVSREGER